MKTWSDINAVDAENIAHWFEDETARELVAPLLEHKEQTAINDVLEALKNGNPGQASYFAGVVDGIRYIASIYTGAKQISAEERGV